jgi:hypothetical protein
MNKSMRAISLLFALFISLPALAGEFDLLVSDYLKKVASGETGSLQTRSEFANQLADDTAEFKVCAGKSCSVRMRENPVLRKQERDFTLWEVRFDVYLNGKPKVRRSGCYLVEKTDRGLAFSDYIYECYGK